VTDGSHTVGPTEDARLVRLARMARDDAEAILDLLGPVLEAQWDRGCAPARNDTGRRAKGGHADPTADVALDEDRLHIRSVVKRAQGSLFQATYRLRGVRRGLERALDEWEGANDKGEEQ
jgi:hypothetical protein